MRDPADLKKAGFQLVIVSGLSGSGKSTILNALEDMGFTCVDNLPACLLDSFVGYAVYEAEKCEASKAGDEQDDDSFRHSHFALLINCRTEEDFGFIEAAKQKYESDSREVQLIYSDAQDEALLRRFKETRRPHPLMLSSGTRLTLTEALLAERNLLSGYRAAACRIFDTTGYTPHNLRLAVEEHFSFKRHLSILLSSFGFKYGVPHNVDLVVDVRFLPNPHFVSELREKTGLDREVAEYVFNSGEAQEFLDKYFDLLKYLIPRYKLEGKSNLTVGIGCTGGRHRSVALSERLAIQLSDSFSHVTVRHRDADKVT